LRKIEGEVLMLVCGILILQSQSLGRARRTIVLLLKRFIVKGWARGTRLKLE
jgi:hypothetical protein